KGKERELALLGRLQEHLEAEKPLRILDLAPEERSELAGFAFLSLRPLLVVLNVPESEVAAPLPEAIRSRARAAGGDAMVLSAPPGATRAREAPGGPPTSGPGSDAGPRPPRPGRGGPSPGPTPPPSGGARRRSGGRPAAGRPPRAGTRWCSGRRSRPRSRSST